MTYITLFGHQWKSFIRNERWRRNILSRILLIILVLYMLFLMVMLGMNIDKLLQDFPGSPAHNFNRILLWYFISDLTGRCMLQPLPVLDTIPYMRLRTRRSRLTGFFMFRSIWNVFSLTPWFVIIPFAMRIIRPEFGSLHALMYICGFLLMVMFNNYLAVFIRFLSQKQWYFQMLPFSLFILSALLRISGISISELSTGFGNGLMQGNIFVFMAILCAVFIVYIVTFRLIRREFYLDHVPAGKTTSKALSGKGLHFLESYGDTGRYVLLQVRLLLRNKRSKQILAFLPFYIVFAVFIFFNDSEQTMGPLFIIFMVSLIVNIGASMYGGFLFNWDSMWFDGIMARKDNFAGFIKAKYYIMIAMALIIYVPLLIFFAFTGKFSLLMLTALLFFGMGVICFVTIFSALYNNGRMDLSKGRAFNYQGVSATQFISSLLIALLPMAAYILFNLFLNETYTAVLILLIGLIFFLAHDIWIKKIIIPQFKARKYKNLEGFRKLNY